jgi:formate hydrogenlyase subunit 6/NADH:ubiquinone oxidoreductase subunit I
MPHNKFVTREALVGWLDNLTAESTLIGPRWVDQVLLYRPVKSSQEIAWDFDRPLLSAKEFFFPPTERLMSIHKIGQQIQIKETLPEERQVVFGLRPCDARGIRILDAMFLENGSIDPYYARRRENTALIGLACQVMGDNCFCTLLGGSPDDATDVDLMLAEMADGFTVQVVTEKGKRLTQSLPCTDMPPGVTQPDFRLRQNEIFPSLALPSQDTWSAHFNDPYWDSMAEGCLSCRLCAYVCPTCRCFDLRDEARAPGEWERVRCWDSCSGENYRRIAGGHNPRPEKGERLRNRFECKFCYYPQQYQLGSPACTGCGRCIEVCPVGVDITEVMDHFAHMEHA